MKKIIAALLLLPAISMAEITPYGFIKGSYLMTDKMLTTTQLGGATEADKKPFAVGHVDGYSDLQKEGRSQFSFTQSRFGFMGKIDENFSAKIEFDFDGDGTNKNGATASTDGYLRWRQANFTWAKDNCSVTAGKKWTIFKGVLPHTYSVTMVNFSAGNTGFLVDGADYSHKFGEHKVAFELHNMSDNALTEVGMPVIAAAGDFKFGQHNVGVALKTATLKHETLASTGKDSSASGYKAYYSSDFSNLNVRAEFYSGTNLGSIATGALAAAKATNDEGYAETGYFVSLKYQSGKHGFFGGIGTSKFNDDDDVDDTALAQNTLTRFGYDNKVTDKATFFVEYQAFTSGWKQAATGVEDSSGSLIDTGFMLKF